MILIYPDSAPSNWIERLEFNGVPFAVSPLHDRDRFTKDDMFVAIEARKASSAHAEGEYKKPHYHVLLAFNNPTTQNNVSKIAESVNGPRFVMHSSSPLKAYEYLWHKNNPEKTQYLQDDVQVFAGFDITLYKPDISEKQRIYYLKRCRELIREHDIRHYSDLIDICIDSEDDNLFEVASKNTIFLCEYIKGRVIAEKDRQRDHYITELRQRDAELNGSEVNFK